MTGLSYITLLDFAAGCDEASNLNLEDPNFVKQIKRLIKRAKKGEFGVSKHILVSSADGTIVNTGLSMKVLENGSHSPPLIMCSVNSDGEEILHKLPYYRLNINKINE